MKSNKNHGNKKDNDINFVPLDIQEPFKFNGSSLSPMIKFDGTAVSASSKDIFIGFPPVFLNTLNNSVTDSGPITPVPLMPYPDSIPVIDDAEINPKDINTNTNGSNLPISNDGLEYPSQLNSDDLYSYNTSRINEDYLNNIINPIDILRNFDLQDDIIDNSSRGGYTSEDIDNIFKKIECNNPAILATMRTYRIPYPIAKLLIKKVIKLTLDYRNGR